MKIKVPDTDLYRIVGCKPKILPTKLQAKRSYKKHNVIAFLKIKRKKFSRSVISRFNPITRITGTRILVRESRFGKSFRRSDYKDMKGLRSSYGTSPKRKKRFTRDYQPAIMYSYRATSVFRNSRGLGRS